MRRPSTRSSKRSAPAAAAAAAANTADPEAHDEPERKKQKAAAPAWVHSLFSDERRAQWTAFLRAQSFVRVGADFFDVFELAHSISQDQPLGALGSVVADWEDELLANACENGWHPDAFADTLGLELCGSFELLERAVRGDKNVCVDKPLFLHGRFFVDPPEVTAVLKDAEGEDVSSAAGAHWGYFRYGMGGVDQVLRLRTGRA